MNHCLCDQKCCDFSNTGCQDNRELMKDCTCASWTIPTGNAQTIFRLNGFERYSSSGFIRFDVGEVDFVRVTFYYKGVQVGLPIEVFKESSFSFLFTMFDTIIVECPNGDLSSVCEGEICTNSRFPV